MRVYCKWGGRHDENRFNVLFWGYTINLRERDGCIMMLT
jgi:hypothetical protein